MDAPVTGWWRRNAVALVAVAVLAPLSVVVISGNEWADYYLYRSTIPVEPAEADGTVELDGATWGPVRSADVTDLEGLLFPQDTRVIAVAIPVDPGEAMPICLAPTLVEQSTGREWNESLSELGLPSTAEEPVSCPHPTDDAGEPIVEAYELIVPFIVPSDAEGPFWVEVAPVDAIPRFVRFSVDP